VCNRFMPNSKGKPGRQTHWDRPWWDRRPDPRAWNEAARDRHEIGQLEPLGRNLMRGFGRAERSPLRPIGTLRSLLQPAPSLRLTPSGRYHDPLTSE